MITVVWLLALVVTAILCGVLTSRLFLIVCLAEQAKPSCLYQERRVQVPKCQARPFQLLFGFLLELCQKKKHHHEPAQKCMPRRECVKKHDFSNNQFSL